MCHNLAGCRDRDNPHGTVPVQWRLRGCRWREAKWKPQPNGKERLGSGNRVLRSGKCDKRTASKIYGKR
jgi:hypothetical protein